MCVCASASVCSSHNLDILTTDKWKIPRGRMAKLRVIFIVDVCVVCCVCLRSLFIRFGLFYYARKTFANILLRHLLLTNDERTNANAFYAWCARDRMLRSYYFFIMLFFSFSFFLFYFYSWATYLYVISLLFVARSLKTCAELYGVCSAVYHSCVWPTAAQVHSLFIFIYFSSRRRRRVPFIPSQRLPSIRILHTIFFYSFLWYAR